jgi:uncharacterized membrane protein YsdA (DUF1294 family)
LDQVLLAAALLANFVSLACYGLDKFRATSGGARISEANLLSLAFLGPFGALVGMLFFRHKTRKARFLLVPLFVLFQLALLLSFHLF